MPPRLKIYDEQGHRSVDLVYERVSFGRDSSCTVQIRDTMASREHCRIEKSGSEFRLVDLESRNGTKVNGSLVSNHKLSHGDEVSIGEVVIRFEHPDGGSARSSGSKPASSSASNKRPSGISKSTRRVPRAKRAGGGGNEVVIFGAVAGVGLLLALLIIAATSGGGGTSSSGKWLAKAASAIDDGDYMAAEEYLEKAKPKEPDEIARKQALEKSLATARERSADRGAAIEAMNQLKIVMSGAKAGSLEGAKLISAYQDIASRYPGTEAASMARAEATKLGGGGTTGGPKADGKAQALKEANTLAAAREFEKAIRVLFTFWENSGDGDIQDRMDAIKKDGDDAWAKVKQQAEIAVAAENKDRARQLYQDVKRRFGNPWANYADEELSKID